MGKNWPIYNIQGEFSKQDLKGRRQEKMDKVDARYYRNRPLNISLVPVRCWGREMPSYQRAQHGGLGAPPFTVPSSWRLKLSSLNRSVDIYHCNNVSLFKKLLEYYEVRNDFILSKNCTLWIRLKAPSPSPGVTPVSVSFECILSILFHGCVNRYIFL